jgi:hypothetical protein
MQFNKVAGSTVAVAVCTLVLLAMGLFPALSTQLVRAATSTVDEAITYQGRLADANGVALNGSYSMQFLLYASETGGSSIWNSGALPVTVEEGLFKVDLNVDQGDFNGRALWLEIVVGGQILVPRQAIRPAPFALGLRPGASIVASDPGANAFSVQQMATGTAVRVESTDLALYAAGQNFGVYGRQSGFSLGYGGYFTSTNGAGVFGGASGAPSLQNQNVPGVWGQSQQGVGVLGEGSTLGVRGRAATGFGVIGDTSSGGVGVRGIGADFGIYGSTTAATTGRGYAGYFATTTGAGVHGRSTASTSANNLYAPGVWGYSQHGAAIYGEAGPSNVAGYFRGNLIVDGNIVATGSKAGYVLDIALNDGLESLQTGDVVIITGVAEAVIGNIPVPTVRKADSVASTGVMGVVDLRYERNAANGYGQMVDGPVAPGEYVGVVTLGAYQAIWVDASYGAIQPGDLLVSSLNPGHAMKADNPGVGTVIGKALAGLDAGTGTIPVLVTLQ